MKPKIRWKSLSEVFLLLILCWGCEHDYFIEPSGFIATNSGTALEQAKTWYASQGYNRTVWLYPDTKAQNGIPFYSEPSWKYYSETENQRYAAIDVALTDRIRLDFVPHENLDCYRQTGNYHYRRSYTRLVILTDKMNGRKTGFLMTFIPSGKYTEKYLNRLGRTTYLQRDERLDGLVLFHNLNGSFSNGWRYTDGRVSGAVPELLSAPPTHVSDTGETEYVACKLMPCSYTPTPIPTDIPDSTSSTVPADTTGYPEGPISTFPPTTGNDTTSTSVIDGGELPEVSVTPETDSSDYSGGEITIPIIPGGGGGGGYYQGGGSQEGDSGSGGGSGSTPDNPGNEPEVPLVNAIYHARSTLTESQKKLLETALEDFINSGSQYRAIYDNLANPVFPVKLIFRVDPQALKPTEGLAGYINGQILFQDNNCIRTYYIREEMIHAIQDLKFYGRNHMNACRKNVEFEAKVFQDLATELKGEGGWKIGSANQSDEFIDEYNKWIETFINNRNINLFIKRFHEFCSSWTGYAGNYQESFVPEVLMSYFK